MISEGIPTYEDLDIRIKDLDSRMEFLEREHARISAKDTRSNSDCIYLSKLILEHDRLWKEWVTLKISILTVSISIVASKIGHLKSQDPS